MKETKTNAVRVVGVAMALLMLASQAGAQKLIGSGLSFQGNSFMSIGAAGPNFLGVSHRDKVKLSIEFGTSLNGVADLSSFYNSGKGLGGANEPYLRELFSVDTRGWSRMREDYRKSLKLKKPTSIQRSKKAKESVEKPSMRYRKGDRSSLFPGFALPEKFRARMAEREMYRNLIIAYRLVPVSYGLKFGTLKACKFDCECDPCDWLCCWLRGDIRSYRDLFYERVPAASFVDAVTSGQ